jgi:hypothetical protein
VTADLTLLFVVFVALGFLVLRVAGRSLRRAMHRWAHHIERRAIDAALAGLAYVVLGKWLHREQSRPRPPVLQGDDIYRACVLSAWQGGPWACRWCNGLIPRNRYNFCGPRCADEANENHVFDRARSARRRMDGYRCTQCGSAEHLEVDHIDAALGRHREPGCIHHLANLRTLCGGGGRSCHQQRTNGQRRAGVFR